MNYREMSDTELIKLFVDGFPVSIEILINRYKNKVYSYIFYNVKDKQLAEDIFQETFIKVVKSLKEGRYVDNGRFLSWVTRIAHNLMMDSYRQVRRMNVVSNDDFEKDIFNSPIYSDETIEQKMVTEQVHSDIRKIIDFLPEEQREVILLRHYADLSFKEIADITNVSLNTALGRMRYAITNMRKLVKENDICLAVG